MESELAGGRSVVAGTSSSRILTRLNLAATTHIPSFRLCGSRRSLRLCVEALANSKLVANLSAVIEAKHSSGDEWIVTVKAGVTTHHRVRVSRQDVERFAGGASVEKLLQESFRFLLERESNTSILPSFDLPLIGHYFPEYDAEIKTRLEQKH